jgi:hypothetical protein
MCKTSLGLSKTPRKQAGNQKPSRVRSETKGFCTVASCFECTRQASSERFGQGKAQRLDSGTYEVRAELRLELHHQSYHPSFPPQLLHTDYPLQQELNQRRSLGYPISIPIPSLVICYLLRPRMAGRFVRASKYRKPPESSWAREQEKADERSQDTSLGSRPERNHATIICTSVAMPGTRTW